MSKINHVTRLLTIIVTVFSIGYFLDFYRQGSPLLGDFLEMSTEVLPLVLSFSIFVMTWLSYKKNKNNHSLFLGASFLIIGVIDLYHMISLPFMPDFITPNSAEKSALFWNVARLFTAALFLSSTFVFENSYTKIIKKSYMLVSVNILSIIVLFTILFAPGFLPDMYDPDGSSSTIAVFLTILTSVVILYSGQQYLKRPKGIGQQNLICLVYGFIIIIFSNFISLYYDYSGPLLRAAGYYFIYLALYKSSIEYHYEKLAEEQDKLRYQAEEKYQSLFNNANDAILTTDLEDRIKSWNQTAEEIFGWRTEEVIGKTLSELIIPESLMPERKKIIRNAILDKGVAGYETICKRKDGSEINVSMTISPVTDAIQNIVGISGIIRDITDKKRAEEQYETILYTAMDGFIILDSTGHFIDANEACCSMTGYSRDELLKMKVHELIANETEEETSQHLENIIKAASERFETRYRSKDNRLIDIEASITYNKDIKRFFVFTRDITERKRAEEQIRSSLKEKEVLLREIHHRVKNNMQVISSLLRLQSGYIKEEEYIDMFKESQNRIISMSLVHEKLYQSKNFTEINFNDYIRDMVSGLFQSHGVNPGKISLKLNVDDVSLGVDSAVPCGLVINEIVTNSIKHAFPGDRKGEINISLHRTDQNKVELIIGDNGVGIPKDFDIKNTESLGLHLITILVEKQLQGEVNLNNKNGTEFQIKFEGV